MFFIVLILFTTFFAFPSFFLLHPSLINKILIEKKYEIFSSQIRLMVMLILHSYGKVKIAELQKAFTISSGKLEHHLNTLETAGLLRKKVDLFSKRILTNAEITEKGKRLLFEYLDLMKDTLKNIEQKK